MTPLQCARYFIASAGLAVACHSSPEETHPVSVQMAPVLYLHYSTDANVPRDIDSIRIEVVDAADPRSTWFSREDELGPTGMVFPVTLQTYAPAWLSLPRTARVKTTAWKGATARYYDEELISVPNASVVLDVDLSQSCLGQIRDSDAGAVETSCPNDETCRNGSCQPIDRTREALPAYDGGH